MRSGLTNRRLAVTGLAAAALALSLALPTHAQDDPTRAANAYLDRLVGDWVMAGEVRGKPVTYRLHAQRVLKGGWVRLDMADGHAPPDYEASLFLGYDPKAGDVIAHWLDQFGAAGARVVATGRLADGRLVLAFPYAEGAFRDTFTLEGPDAWALVIEGQAADGHWSPFARYRVSRVAP